EPLDYSTHIMRIPRAHTFGETRHAESTDESELHSRRSGQTNPHSGGPFWSDVQGSMEEETQDRYWPNQRRRSEGIIPSVYIQQQQQQQQQRRNSDSGIQGIYRPSQRRHSDGVIKKLCGPGQRGSDIVIREGYVSEERKDREEDIDEQYALAIRDNREELEKCFRAENKLLEFPQHMDQRRNSDGVISTSYRHYQRRHSDGVIRQCISVNQRGLYERTVPKSYMLNPSDVSDEATYSSYSPSDRRSSDEMSQSSYLLDQRRSSIDSIQESYESSDRHSSDEALKTHYWPYHGSDSGEFSHENEWPFHRRNSDEFFQGRTKSNKDHDHFFENTVRREHEVIERIDRAIPINMNKNQSNEQRNCYKRQHPPAVTSNQQASVILKPSQIHREGDIDPEQNEMNWSEETQHETLHKQNYEDMDVPIDLSVKSPTKH
ncbi:hypothetical protein SK128_027207, partial [Halocaridina rubra]